VDAVESRDFEIKGKAEVVVNIRTGQYVNKPKDPLTSTSKFTRTVTSNKDSRKSTSHRTIMNLKWSARDPASRVKRVMPPLPTSTSCHLGRKTGRSLEKFSIYLKQFQA
jgi:hypothetical protein